MIIDKETLKTIRRVGREHADAGDLTPNWKRAWEDLSNAADALHAMMVRKEILELEDET